MGTDFHKLQHQGITGKVVKKEVIECEPTSVLDHSCSPNSPNSTSTRSNSINGVGVSMHDLEGLCVGVEGSVLPWFMGHVDVDDTSLSFKNLLQSGASFGFDGYAGGGGGGGVGGSIQPSGVENFTSFGGGGGVGGGGMGFSSSVGGEFRVCDEKPQVLDPSFGFGQQGGQIMGNPNYYVGSLGYGQLDVQQQHPFLPSVKRVDYGGVGPDHSFVQMSRGSLGMVPQYVQKSMDQDKDSQVSVLRDQLIKVLEMFQTGNFALSEVILARLNHQASLPGNPLLGVVALNVKEELEKLLSMNGMPAIPPPPKSLGLDDVIHKISAFKLFSEVSPVMQFVDFTCTQVILEALEDADTIHVLDFDIGCGSMWASFIHELPLRKKKAPFLKITVLASTSSHHPFELALICDNILEFATEYGVSVDIKVLNLDLFDSTSCSFPGFQLSENEAVAIKFPVWACSHCPFLLPPLVSFMKQCSPKIVMSFDRGGDRCDLTFPSHILHGLNSCSNILESLHGSSIPAEIITKVDSYLIKPSIERIIQGRIHAHDRMQANKMPNWKSVFPSNGFIPAPLSNFTEYQAYELVNKLPVKGFNVEKRGASIVLRWLSLELVSGLAWTCWKV